MIKVVLNLCNDSILDFILVYFDTWLYIDVFRYLTSYWCILVNSCVTDMYIFVFLLYTVYFCAVYCVFLLYSKKIQIENIPVEHHFYCQWRILSVAHLDWVRRRKHVEARRWVLSAAMNFMGDWEGWVYWPSELGEWFPAFRLLIVIDWAIPEFIWQIGKQRTHVTAETSRSVRLE
jgi:hypothetical protein